MALPAALALQPDTVLQPARWCVTREERDRYLFYNSRTDELHLVPPLGMYVYRLCDGLRTVGEVQELLCAGRDGPREGAEHLTRYLAALVERGVLEVRP